MYRKKPTAWHFLGIAVAVAAVGAMILYAVLGEVPTLLDRDTLCPAGDSAPPPALNVIVLDRTEPYTAIQQKDILAALEKLALDSVPGERFELFEILAEDSLSDRPLDTVCNPGRYRNETIRDKLDSSPVTRKLFEERFVKRMRERLEEKLSIPPQASSPIMEMLQAVSVTRLKPSRAPEKRLIIVSDLMQHSRAFSQYTSRITLDAFARTPFYAAAKVDLTGTMVYVLYVPRTAGASRQPEGHLNFWNEYLSRQGARLRVHVVEGGAWRGR